MSHHVYKILEIVGSSPISIDDAIKTAIMQAGKSVKHMRWFEVVQVRGEIHHEDVQHFQVTLKVGFTIEDEPKKLKD
jgi:flavin-binding protein dodecin